ncbi:hypothetical protein CI109_102183 [Kwoniella shandongensis]|uniref:Uncharacterized protein n=1 Tax=Kwoniella shandongensis TaxID=1734106 RepID=A0A5M6BZ62_9TREE|nr:uncharacterized protein CI109_003658 [Kwoniella shandongensis]KAA5528003.1 hypothetical protein CI109_003658 [Kwoniella shandongensis]
MATSHLRTALTASWTALHTTQYGLAITSLNGVQAAVTCGAAGGNVGAHVLSTQRLKDCIFMTPAQFGLVVSIFTLGGLIGSLGATAVTHQLGRIGTFRLAAITVLLGSTAVGTANSIPIMIIGRILVGLGCGLGTVTVPVFLSEIAPPAIKRSLGIMNQVFIVFGMLIGQSLSFPFAKPYLWRYVLIASAGIAVLQLAGSFFIREPAKETHDPEEAREHSPLVSPSEIVPLGIKDLLASKDPLVTRGFLVVLVTQLSQQFCGVSPVMYFSTRILTPVFGDNSRMVALFIILLKIPLTILPAFLIERLGTRRLLIVPTAVMGLAAFLLAFGINTDAPALSIASIFLFVSAFSVGLGPVTWVVLPEVMPKHAVTAAGSVGVALNWTANFCMGAAFLPLQQWMSGGKETGEGNIFFVLAVTCVCAMLAMKVAFKVRERVAL